MNIRPRTTEIRRDGLTDFFSRLSRHYDLLQVAVIAALVSVGFIFIKSTGLNISETAASAVVWRQTWWLIIGVAGWFMLANIDYRDLKIVSWGFYLACVVLLIVVLEVGLTSQGATRWLALPGGMRLQPSEFTKLALIMTIATLLTTMNFSVNRFGGLMLIAALLLVPFLLIMKEPDLGSALILVPVVLTLVFLGGLKWRYIITVGLLLAVLGTAAFVNEYKRYRPLLREYQWNRIMTFLNPEQDLQDSGLNQYQARLAVGSGGLFGKGIGQGTQNTLGYLPRSVSNNDFIFSVIAEETGFIGCLALLGLYGLMLYSVIRSAILAADDFGRYLGGGIAAVFFVHIFVNIGMSIGLTPITGLSLPLVSYGGSFMILSMACLGLMQSVYRHGAGAGDAARMG